MDFLGFSKLMKQRRANLAGEVHEAVKSVTNVYLVVVADATPVDTSAAVSNWQIGVNSHPSGVIPPRVPGRFGSTALESFNATIAAGKEVIDSSKPKDVLHVVNNIHYIKGLDDGTISTQAPAGMTAIAALAAKRVLARVKVVKPT